MVALLFNVYSTHTIGAVIGLILGFNLMPMILNQVLKNYGIVRMPIIIHYGGVFISLILSINVLNLYLKHRLLTVRLIAYVFNVEYL